MLACYAVFAVGYLLNYAELKDAMAVIGFSRFQVGGRPLWFIGSIRIMLRLQTHGRSLRISDTVFARYGIIQEIAGINLDAGFVGINLQRDAGDGAH